MLIIKIPRILCHKSIFAEHIQCNLYSSNIQAIQIGGNDSVSSADSANLIFFAFSSFCGKFKIFGGRTLPFRMYGCAALLGSVVGKTGSWRGQTSATVGKAKGRVIELGFAHSEY